MPTQTFSAAEILQQLRKGAHMTGGDKNAGALPLTAGRMDSGPSRLKIVRRGPIDPRRDRHLNGGLR